MCLLIGNSLAAIQAPIDFSTLRSAELVRHNYFRSRHGSAPLTINSSLNTLAQNYASVLLSTNKFVHSPSAEKGLYGENLYYAWGSPTYTYANYTSSNSWYAENVYYNYATGLPMKGKTTGHFTAMIWRGVRSVGFGYAAGPGPNNRQTIYVVAHYYPTPNIAGQFTKNVAPRI